MYGLITLFYSREKGQDLAEYAIFIGVIALVVYGAATLLGLNLLGVYDYLVDQFPFW